MRHLLRVTHSAGPMRGRTPEGSIADLLDSYTRPALALARRIVVDDQLAEDVVQEAFVAYWCHPATFEAARGPFAPWFLALVHHKAVDAVRREMSQRRRLDAAASLLDDEPAPDVADGVLDRIGDARVRTALSSLSPVQREALVLAYWGGFTQREIAARTGAPLGTVKTRMLVGMRRVQQALSAAAVPAG